MGDKLLDGIGIDFLASCQLFQLFVRFGVAFPAKYGLNGFSQNRNVLLQICFKCRLIEQQFSKSLQGAFECNDRMRRRHAQIAEYGRIGEIPL